MAENNTTELNTALQKSGLQPELLKSLIKIIPQLSPYLLLFLSEQSEKSIFPDIAFPIFRVVFDSHDALSELEKGNVSLILKYVNSSITSPSFQFGKWAIPAVLDALNMLQTGKVSASPELLSAINSFELRMFNNLPTEEQQELCKNRLLFFIKNCNLQMELKRMFLTAQYTQGKSWAEKFRLNIEDNEELIGQRSIMVEEKAVPPSVKNWLKDYITSVPKPVSQRGAFEQIQYIKQAKNVQQLTNGEKDTLLEIIKLHAWLTVPSVTEEEIAAYENELARKNGEIVADEPQPVRKEATSMRSSGNSFPDIHRVSKTPFVFPKAPSNPPDIQKEYAFSPKPQASPEEIEKKLQDLKNKTE